MTQTLRNNYAQQKKRQSSNSKYLDKKHAAHIFSLELARYIQSKTPGPMADRLRDAVNTQENFRMVNAHTNQVLHHSIDTSLIRKTQTGEKLTVAEESRAKLQVKFIQNNPDFPPGHWKAAKDFYKSLRTKDGKTLWDSRKDKY